MAHPAGVHRARRVPRCLGCARCRCLSDFDKNEFDRILGLPPKGWKAVVIATAGVRSAEDAYANAEKVRFPLNEVVQHL
jgi:hypothetical protein